MASFSEGNGEARIMDFVPLSRSVFKTKIHDVPQGEKLSLSSQVSPAGSEDAGFLPDHPNHQLMENPLDSQVLMKVVKSFLCKMLSFCLNKLLHLLSSAAHILKVVNYDSC